MKRTKQSQKRTKFLLLLIVLTAILSITATYAWFSTQKEVEINGMRLNVEVAESLQISLDGDQWAQSITIADMRQFYGTYGGSATTFAIYQAEAVTSETLTNHNYVPTELLPVSTAGEISGGKLQFVQGTLGTSALGTESLTGITACTEDDINATGSSTKLTTMQTNNKNHPYLVFDMYLRNMSAKADGQFDDLFLNNGSKVWVDTSTSSQEGIGVAGTGLENTARVGFVVQGQTTDVSSVGETVRTLGSSTADQAAIWEPNYKEHTDTVFNNNGRGIKKDESSTHEVATYGIKTGTSSVDDVNSTTDSNLVAVKVYRAPYTTVDGGVTGTVTNDNDPANVKGQITRVDGDGTNKLGVAANKISKVRVYVWLEGQDPDTISVASTGDRLNVTIKITKATNTKGTNSYEGTGVNP